MNFCAKLPLDKSRKMWYNRRIGCDGGVRTIRFEENECGLGVNEL